MRTLIQLKSNPNQTFKVTVPGDTRNLSFRLALSYNQQAGYWVLSIYDTTGNAIILNIPLLCGYNLLSQNRYMNIGSVYVVNTSGGTEENPNDTNVTNFALLWELV